MSLKGKTIVITGGSRGIGKAIAIRAAKDGANVAILAKTTTPHPKLPGTIFTAAKEIERQGGVALALPCDIRDEVQVQNAIHSIVQKFGSIDILVNNASAISLTDTLATTMKKYDLMNQVNQRATFMVTKYAIPFLLKSNNPHVLMISPPLDSIKERWFAPHVAYSMSKFGMSLCVLGFAGEFPTVNVNALWPRTIIDTAALQVISTENIGARGRRPEIVADAAHAILVRTGFTGNFCIDEQVLGGNLDDYATVKGNKDLLDDFFIEPRIPDPIQNNDSLVIPNFESSRIFQRLSNSLKSSSSNVGIYEFEITATNGKIQTWVVDLEKCRVTIGKPIHADISIKISDSHFVAMSKGQLEGKDAFMRGLLKVRGNLALATQLETILKGIGQSKM